MILSSLVGCSMANGGSAPLVTNSVEDSEAVLTALEEADVITAKKAALSFGDRWKIKADGVEVGEIRGQEIYLIGDTYSLFSNNGNLVASEAEGYRVVHHRAKTYDYNNAERGEIKQTLSFFLSEYKINNKAGETVGSAKQKLNVALSLDVLDTDGQVDYKISKKILSFGADVVIENNDKNSTVNAIDALWLAVIASEVHEAKSSNNNSSKS